MKIKAGSSKRSIKSRDKKKEDTNIINQRKDIPAASINIKSIINLSVNLAT